MRKDQRESPRLAELPAPRSDAKAAASASRAPTTAAHATGKATAMPPPTKTAASASRAPTATAHATDKAGTGAHHTDREGAERVSASGRGQKTSRVFGRGGIAMVRLTCRLPEDEPPDGFPENCGEMWTAFLARAQALAEEIATLCRTELLPRMQAAYDADPDPRKRFRCKGAAVTLTCEIAEEKEGVFEIRWHFAVTEAGKTAADHTFCEHLFTALPPSPAKPERRKRKDRPKNRPEKPVNGEPPKT